MPPQVLCLLHECLSCVILIFFRYLINFGCGFIFAMELSWKTVCVLLWFTSWSSLMAWYLIQEDPLQEEISTHSSTLAWEIPWTEEPGRPQSKGLQRIGPDIGTQHAHMHHRGCGQWVTCSCLGRVQLSARVDHWFLFESLGMKDPAYLVT